MEIEEDRECVERHICDMKAEGRAIGGGKKLATRVGTGRGRTIGERGKLEQSMMGAMYEEGELGMTHIYSHSI